MGVGRCGACIDGGPLVGDGGGSAWMVMGVISRGGRGRERSAEGRVEVLWGSWPIGQADRTKCIVCVDVAWWCCVLFSLG